MGATTRTLWTTALIVITVGFAPAAAASGSPWDEGPGGLDCIGLQHPAPGITCIGVEDGCVGANTVDGCNGVRIPGLEDVDFPCIGLENPAPGITCIGAEPGCVGVNMIDGCRGVPLP